MKWLRILQQIDRRVLYALLFLAVSVPFVFYLPGVEVPVSPQTEALYSAIERLPPNAFVLFGCDWSASTIGENGAQTEVLMRHLMRRKQRFALLAFEPQARTLTQSIALRLQKEYGVTEGVHWCNWGYRPAGNMDTFLVGLLQDVKKMVPVDVHGKPTAALPVMQGINSGKDFAMLLSVTPSSTYQTYIQFVQGQLKIPMGLAPTAVMSAEAFTYLDSKQLVGMVNGLQGAIEYEKKLGVRSAATRASWSLSFAHILVLFFIALGNVAMLLERSLRARTGGVA